MAKTLTKDEIKYLMLSGFTVAEIREMQEDAQKQEQNENPVVNPEQDETQEQDETPKQDETQEQDETSEQNGNTGDMNAELFKSLREEIESLKKAIQTSNRKNIFVETGENQVSMTDILNNIAEEYK